MKENKKFLLWKYFFSVLFFMYVFQGGEFQTLGQIEICVDKQFQLTDCEKTRDELQISDNEILPFVLYGHSGFTVCESSVPVYYPPLTEAWKSQGLFSA